LNEQIITYRPRDFGPQRKATRTKAQMQKLWLEKEHSRLDNPRSTPVADRSRRRGNFVARRRRKLERPQNSSRRAETECASRRAVAGGLSECVLPG